MALVKGINRQVLLGIESTFGTLPAAGLVTAQILRRVNITAQLNKDIYQSQEILPSKQVRTSRHGVRRVSASIDGELSQTTYKMLFEGLMQNSFETTNGRCWMPSTGHVEKSYTLESYYPDSDTTPLSERYKGMRVSQISLNLPATGFVTFNAQLVGQDMSTGTARYFTAPVAATSTPALAAVSGTVIFDGAEVALITGAQVTIASAIEANPVLGSNIVPEIFQGRLTANGSMSVFVKDNAFYTAFIDEAEVDLTFKMSATADPDGPDYFLIGMSRVKLNSAAKNDSDRSIIQQCQFEALENTAASDDWEESTIWVEDTTLIV